MFRKVFLALSVACAFVLFGPVSSQNAQGAQYMGAQYLNALNAQTTPLLQEVRARRHGGGGRHGMRGHGHRGHIGRGYRSHRSFSRGRHHRGGVHRSFQHRRHGSVHRRHGHVRHRGHHIGRHHVNRRHHGHHSRSYIRRHGRHYGWGPSIGFWFYDGYYWGDCAWLRRRAIVTGSSYWWHRYRLCRYW